MTATQYGRTGVGALVVGGLLAAFGVARQDVGANPDTLTFGASLAALVLFAVGIVALVLMIYGVYGEET
ncbi:MAG: hypothetical protein PPP58_09245, partial [Natronomonas sp.]